MKHRIAILGASGYTGAELVRLIASHPSMQIVALSADRKAGMAMAEVFPFLRHLDLPRLQKIDEIDFSNVDLCFCALPHATSQAVISQLPRNLKIVDLSADFRLRDPAEYEKWYGNPHAAVDLQAEAVYGLTEFYRAEIAKGRLVARCISTSPTAKTRPSFSTRAWARTSRPAAGLRMKSMLQFVVTASATGPICAKIARYIATSARPNIAGPDTVPPGRRCFSPTRNRRINPSGPTCSTPKSSATCAKSLTKNACKAARSITKPMLSSAPVRA